MRHLVIVPMPPSFVAPSQVPFVYYGVHTHGEMAVHCDDEREQQRVGTVQTAKATYRDEKIRQLTTLW
jgi:hypothetical protein